MSSRKRKLDKEARSVLKQLPKTGVSLLSVTTSAQMESLCGACQLVQCIKIAEDASGATPSGLLPKSSI